MLTLGKRKESMFLSSVIQSEKSKINQNKEGTNKEQKSMKLKTVTVK